MKIALIATFALFASPVLAGDAAVGEKEFGKCKACHALVAADGTVVVKGGKTGPNLHGVVGRPVASVADFKYGEDIVAAGATGAVWDEAMLAEYMTDPAVWLAKTLAMPEGQKAKTKMTFKLKAKGEDVAAYLATLK